jgi:hypothetical protein
VLDFFFLKKKKKTASGGEKALNYKIGEKLGLYWIFVVTVSHLNIPKD